MNFITVVYVLFIFMQNYSEVPNLPGLEEDQSLKEEMTAKSAACKAYRCFYTAQVYVIGKQYAQAIALLKQTQSYATDAIKLFKPIKIKDKVCT